MNKALDYHNHFSFQPLPYVDCSHAHLTSSFSSLFSQEELFDGVLFFHKGGHYVIGDESTPLVCWTSRKSADLTQDLLKAVEDEMDV
jgi:hypothetical protein